MVAFANIYQVNCEYPWRQTNTIFPLGAGRFYYYRFYSSSQRHDTPYLDYCSRGKN